MVGRRPDSQHAVGAVEVATARVVQRGASTAIARLVTPLRQQPLDRPPDGLRSSSPQRRHLPPVPFASGLGRCLGPRPRQQLVQALRIQPTDSPRRQVVQSSSDIIASKHPAIAQHP